MKRFTWDKWGMGEIKRGAYVKFADAEDHVRAVERATIERCAKVCDDLAQTTRTTRVAYAYCATSIRALLDKDGGA